MSAKQASPSRSTTIKEEHKEQNPLIQVEVKGIPPAPDQLQAAEKGGSLGVEPINESESSSMSPKGSSTNSLWKFVDPGRGEVVPPGPHHLKKADGVGSLAAEPINESRTLNIRTRPLSGNGDTAHNR